jgi:GT2 family glycosyltransferase
VIRENLTGQGYDVSTGPVLFYDRTLNSDLVRLWRTQYKIFHLFDFYWLIGSNMATTRDAYDRIGGHQDISVLEDYDLSVRLFREGDIACCDDRRQAVYTSARRFRNLSSYMMTYLYGHYHYHVTKDRGQLLRYPRFDAADRPLPPGTGGSGRAARKAGPREARLER